MVTMNLYMTKKYHLFILFIHNNTTMSAMNYIRLVLPIYTGLYIE
jgi:hypothetical protein